MTTLLASPSLELQSRFSRPRCPNLGKRERYDRPKRVLKNEAGPSKLSRRARLFDLGGFLSSLAESFAPGEAAISAMPLPPRLGLLRRPRRRRFLPACFTSPP